MGEREVTVHPHSLLRRAAQPDRMTSNERGSLLRSPLEAIAILTPSAAAERERASEREISLEFQLVSTPAAEFLSLAARLMEGRRRTGTGMKLGRFRSATVPDPAPPRSRNGCHVTINHKWFRQNYRYRTQNLTRGKAGSVGERALHSAHLNLSLSHSHCRKERETRRSSWTKRRENECAR